MTPADVLTVARLGRLVEMNCGDELSAAQFRTLGSLLGGDERASKLAARLAVPKPTLTALVDGLVGHGFVTREKAEGDRRVVRLSITEAGRAAHDRAATHLVEAFDDLLHRCPDPAAVLEVLQVLHLALDERFAERVALEERGARP